MSHEDKIVKGPKGFQVMSKAGKPLGKPFATREANERLRQIEAAVEAKGDSAIVRRIDYLGAIHFDPERQDGAVATVDPNTGFLRVDARLTRVGVFEYGDREGNTWGELRTEDEVFNEDALRSFELAVLTDDHPQEFVSAANVKDVQVGNTGTDVRRDGDFMVASILVTDPTTIAKIRDGKTELSCGYTATVIQDAGVASDGTPFAGRQTQIRGNHVAVVDKGRAGSECRLLIDAGDAYSLQPTKEVPMKTDKTPDVATIIIDGEEIAVDSKVAAYVHKLNEDATASSENKDTMPTNNEDATALRARVDVLEADAATRAETEAARIDARVSLVTASRNVLGADTPTRGVSDAALMRAVVLNVNPALEGRLDANKDAPGYLVAAFDAALDLHRERTAATDEANTAIFDALNGGSTGSEDKVDLDAEYQAFLNKRTNVRLVAGGEG